MQELITTFHIDWKLIVAQLVNFAIVLFVLYKFAYGPMLKLMNERTEKIEKGLKNSEEAQQKLLEIAQKEKAVLVEARKAAQEIVAGAEAVAIKSKEEILVSAKNQSEKILEDAVKRIETEKNKMLQEVKAQIAGLVISATEKIIGEKVDSTKDKELIDKAIKD
jgi:F-type H+-transporting ATPase subunit b